MSIGSEDGVGIGRGVKVVGPGGRARETTADAETQTAPAGPCYTQSELCFSRDSPTRAVRIHLRDL